MKPIEDETIHPLPKGFYPVFTIVGLSVFVLLLSRVAIVPILATDISAYTVCLTLIGVLGMGLIADVREGRKVHIVPISIFLILTILVIIKSVALAGLLSESQTRVAVRGFEMVFLVSIMFGLVRKRTKKVGSKVGG
jgi:hypothetical protein